MFPSFTPMDVSHDPAGVNKESSVDANIYKDKFEHLSPSYLETGTSDEFSASQLFLAKENDVINGFKPASVIVDTDGTINTLTKKGVVRTLIAIGVSFMCTLSAFDSFSNLQSTLNTSQGIGTTGLAMICVFMVLTSLFVTTLTTSRFGAKLIIGCSLLTYIAYMSTGFYPSWYTVIPASVVLGVGASHMWLAVVIYITDIAKRYAKLTNTKEGDRVNLFLGIFFGFMYTSQIWGNLFSSLVFQRSSYNAVNTSDDICGPRFCPISYGNGTAIILPSQTQVYTFTAVCIGLCIVAVLVLVVFAAAVGTGSQKRSSVLGTLKQVKAHLLTSRNQQLLILPSISAGLWNGFAVGDFTMAYISCPYGIENVGFVMMTFGVGQSVCSVLFGKLSQYSGNFVIYVIGFVTEMGVMISLLLWTPVKDYFSVVFILSALLGMGVAIHNPIVISLHTQFMKDNLEVAHSSYRLLNSLGWAIAFGYSSVLCTNYKIYILSCVLVIAQVCVTILNRESKSTDR